MTETKALTIREAYNKGWRSRAGDTQEALERFTDKFCDHSYYKFCDLCTAWHNGWADQGEPGRGVHAKRCPLGLAHRGNHEDCDWDA